MRFLLTGLLLAGCAGSTNAPAPRDARAIHERLLVLDTHLDTPANFGRRGWSIADRHTVGNDMSQVDLPRMKDGGLDGGFWVIYTPQGPLTAQGFADARAFALKRSDEITAMIAANPQFVLATRADEAEAIAAQGKRIVYQSIENSYPLGEDLSLLAEFHRRGVRMAGPVHSADNQFADSTTGKRTWNGLSPLGRRWVAEMNRLGMVIDASHASDAAFDAMLNLSKTPLILSHSGPKAAFDHPRNLDDTRIKALAAKGGVVQMNSLFLAPTTPSSPERLALNRRRADLATMSPAEQRALAAEFAALNARTPNQGADFEMFMASMLHVLKLVGSDHVGLGADWDGGGGVRGIEDVAALPKITARLVAEGYSDADLAKIMSGNALRVLRAAEAGAAR